MQYLTVCCATLCASIRPQTFKTIDHDDVNDVWATHMACTYPQDLRNSGLLVEVPKFSKFLHGAALLLPSLVRNTPPWYACRFDFVVSDFSDKCVCVDVFIVLN